MREAIAEYLTRARAVACEPQQILIVHGSQQALALASEVLLDAGDAAVVDAESLPHADAAKTIASGTATLEAALFKRPMVIAYRMGWLSWRIMRGKQLQPWVGLPNIQIGRAHV